MEKLLRRPGDYVIPHEAIPEVMSRITVSPEDKFVCVERTEPMFTTYWATAGEISPFFLAVMKDLAEFAPPSDDVSLVVVKLN